MGEFKSFLENPFNLGVFLLNEMMGKLNNMKGLIKIEKSFCRVVD